MKKTAVIIFSIFSLFTATAQEKQKVTIGNGNTTKITREVGSFSKITVKGPFDVRLVSGDQGSVSVEADNNIIDLVTTQVIGNELQIVPMEGKLFKSSKGNKIIVKVPVSNLNEVAMLGSGSITGKTTLKKDIKVVLEGSGKVELTVDSDRAETVVLGSGDVTIKGTTQHFECLVAGSGIVKANALEAKKVNVTVSGSGSAKVYTIEAITGRITGSGNIAYAGSPKERDLKRTGSGDFSALLD